MINLLPTAHAESIRYGRQNTVLRNWLIGLGLAIAGLVIILAGGWVYLSGQQNNYRHDIANTNQQLKAEDLTGVQKSSKEITGDIQVINKILSTEVRFSDLIQAIGSDMPPGAILGSLSLSNKVSGALDLSASTTTYSSAAQVAVNLSQAKNELFSNVDIINISCGGGQANQNYKCTATYRALFSKTAQTKFLSVAKAN